MTELDTWLQVGIALLSSGSAAALFKLGRDVLRWRASKQYDRGYGNILKVFRTMQHVLADVRANRIMVLKSENGGGIPVPGASVTSSVVHEVFDPPARSVFEVWQRVPLDDEYSRVLAEVNTAGEASLHAGDLKESSPLRDLIEAAGSTHVHFWRVCATPSALLYLSIHYSSEDDEPMSARDRATARTTVHTLCSIFSKHHQLVKTDA